MFVDEHAQVEYDLMTPRIAVNKNKRKILQNTMYWCKLRITQSKAIILYDPLPAVCIEKVVSMKVRRRIIQ